MTTESVLPILIGNLLRNSNPDVVFSVRDRKYLFFALVNFRPTYNFDSGDIFQMWSSCIWLDREFYAHFISH